MNSKDLELFSKMSQLIQKADTELTAKYENQYYPGGYGKDKETKHEIIEQCLYSAYQEIWDDYWKLANNLSFDLNYYDPETTYQESILTHFRKLKEYVESYTDEIAQKTIDDIYEELITTQSIESICKFKIKLDNYINNNI